MTFHKWFHFSFQMPVLGCTRMDNSGPAATEQIMHVMLLLTAALVGE